jgi:serine/threonine-protein kinase HipA
MRQAKILFKGAEAGILTQHDDGGFTYRYHDQWLADSGKPPISLTLPKTDKEYRSEHLFPFFFNMLPEGTNKQVVCRHMRIDKDDHFGLLLTAARHDTIGAVTVKKIELPI